ncbi:MAG TPA: fatty acid--CoA ligase family protein [Steroidobacteraceae bacterium]|nr:fatty acid--CoA ligase family protein [Steroidobacteraceae bacterium]
MLGYYRDPAATAAALRPGGWLATGDLARWRPDGSIALVGRCKEMIIRAGFNVYPAEVEAAINRQPGVLQSGVVGRKRADGDEEVVAFVQPRVDASLEVATLRAGLRAQLAPYKVPAQIVVVEQLPLGSSGKIHKAVLMEQAVCLPS